MPHSLKMLLAAIAIAATTGAAMAATHHISYHRSSYHRDSAASHARYAEECGALAGQWSSAIASHNNGRRLRRAERQESIGARDCRSGHTASLRAGVRHYRSALRMLGVKPQV